MPSEGVYGVGPASFGFGKPAAWERSSRKNHAQTKGWALDVFRRAQVRPRNAAGDEPGFSKQVPSALGSDGGIRRRGGRGNRLAPRSGEERREAAGRSRRRGDDSQLCGLVLSSPHHDRDGIRARPLPDVFEHQSSLPGDGGDAGGG